VQLLLDELDRRLLALCTHPPVVSSANPIALVPHLLPVATQAHDTEGSTRARDALGSFLNTDLRISSTTFSHTSHSFAWLTSTAMAG
jgi:hypothetical protein